MNASTMFLMIQKSRQPLWSAAVLLVASLHLAGPDSAIAQDEGIRFPATLEADQRTELKARIKGYVASVHADIGDHVTAGQVLITLDAPELAADVVRQQQMVKKAEASLLVASSAVETSEARLLQARSSLQEQAALLQLRSTQRDRYVQLVRGGAVQQEKLDEAEYALLAVQAVTQKIEADVSAASADVDAAKSQVLFARSGIEVAQAELAYAQVQAEMRTIRAPFSGLITLRSVDPGAMVSSTDSQSLLVIESIHVLRGVMTIPADAAQHVRPGQVVSFTGFGNEELTAPDGGPPRVSRMSQSLEMKTRTMRVEIDLANPINEETGQFQLLGGQYGTATIQTTPSK